jgi:hypothetical protein
MKEGVMNLFSIEKGSAFMKGALSILLMSSFLPNIELITLIGKAIMSLGGSIMLGVSIFQGLLNIQKTKREIRNQELANRYQELENSQLESEISGAKRFKRVGFIEPKPNYDADSIR